MLRKLFALSYFQVDQPIKIRDRDKLDNNRKHLMQLRVWDITHAAYCTWNGMFLAIKPNGIILYMFLMFFAILYKLMFLHRYPCQLLDCSMKFCGKRNF